MTMKILMTDNGTHSNCSNEDLQCLAPPACCLILLLMFV